MIYPWLHKSEHFFDMYGDNELLTGRERGFDRKKINDYLQTIDKCYLSGRHIDVNDINTYEFDHIYPRTLGGSNTFDNLGITRPEANRAKNDLTVDEFIELCKDVLINFGYDVIKK
jgi:CRISPR/Cas system Type II protein with McrA/HNH and RuvC-like nuclease domain